MLTREHFLKAADLIEKYGLSTSGTYCETDTGCLCTVGALAVAAGVAYPNTDEFALYKRPDKSYGNMIPKYYDDNDNSSFDNFLDNWNQEQLEVDFTRFLVGDTGSPGRDAVESYSDLSSAEDMIAQLREFGNMKDV